MKFLQSVLNKIQQPISFTAEISEAVARITLREICGAVRDECEFNGEVSQNSFSFIKNNTSRSYMKGIPRVILDGEFYEENGKTCVTVCPKIRLCDIVNIFIALLLGAILIVLGIFGLPASLIAIDIEALLTSLLMTAFGAGIWAFEYWVFSISFRKSVEIIKTALCLSEKK